MATPPVRVNICAPPVPGSSSSPWPRCLIIQQGQGSQIDHLDRAVASSQHSAASSAFQTIAE
jgi:hypothetical protein